MTPPALNYRISTTSDLTKGWFIALGLPEPDAFEFQEYSKRVGQSTGGESLQGYLTYAALWDDLTARQAYDLKRFVSAVAVGGDLYLTVLRNNADSCLDQDWIDIRGKPVMPAFKSPPRSRGLMYMTVELRLNNVVVVNSPASGI